jgi:hypothetical protein
MRGHWRLSSRLSRTTIAICDVHERCTVVSRYIIGMDRVCFAMSVFVYNVCSECYIILDNEVVAPLIGIPSLNNKCFQ